MKKLFTLLMTLWLAIGSLFAVNLKGGEVLYLKPNENWIIDNARFAVYFYGTGDSWTSMTAVAGETNLYKATVPSGQWTNMIFCRMNPSNSTNNWNNKWNQTGNLSYDGTNNCCSINSGQWDCGTNVKWSFYSTEPVITVVTSPEFPATTIEETATATLKYTVDNSEEKATITIDNDAFTAVDNNGTVTITFAPTEAKEYTATITIAVGEVKETVEISATGLAKDVVKDPEVLNLTAPEFAEIIEGNTTTAVANYELLNADEAEAKVEGEGFEITEQELGKVTIKFAPTKAGEYAGTLFILVAGETLKEVAFTATAKPAPYYAIRGDMTDWSDQKDIKLTPNDDKSEYFIKGFEIASGKKFKVVYVNEDNATTWYGTDKVQLEAGISNSGQGDGDIALTPAGKYDIYYKVQEGKIWIQKYVEPTPEPEPIDPYAAIRGLGEGTEEEVWSEEQQIKLAINEDAEQEEWFIKGLEIAEGQAFKVVYVNAKSETTWYGVTAVEENEELGSIGEDNITLAAGKYDLYFKIAGSIWIAPVKAEEPEPEPVVITFVDEVTFPKTFVGETTNDIIEFTLENAAEDADVVVEVTGEAFSVAEVQDNLIYLAFAPEAEGEYAGVLTVTVGEVSESLEFTAVASPVEPKIIITSELPEFPVTVIGETSEATITYEVENIDADADVSVSIQGEGFSGEDVDGTITIIFTPTEEKVYTGAVTITAGEVSQDVVLFAQAVAEEEPVEPKINIIVADFERNTAEVGDETDAAIVYSLENIESAEVEIEGEYVTFEQTEVEEGFMIAVFFRPEEVGEFPGKLTITAGEISEEIEFTFIATEPEPDNTITFTVQVPEGTKECWIAGTPGWAFIQMEKVEDEENLFTITVENTVLDREQWKYASGAEWQYSEVIEGNGNRTEPEDPYDVVTAWQKLYDPDFQPIDPYYAIRGDMTGWTDYKNDIKLTEDADNDQWYIKEFEVDGTEAFKVVYVDENANVCDDCWYSNIEESVSTDIYTGGNGDNILLVEGKYDIYFKPGTGAMWIAKVIPDTPTDAEEAVAELIYAIDGTIYAPAPFAIIDLSGKDVTNANGDLEGAYIVKTQNSVTKVLVK